jgi:hypothetical protein
MLFDWNGILNRIGNIALDIKQAQEKNKVIGFTILGIAVFFIFWALFLRRK